MGCFLFVFLWDLLCFFNFKTHSSVYMHVNMFPNLPYYSGLSYCWSVIRKYVRYGVLVVYGSVWSSCPVKRLKHCLQSLRLPKGEKTKRNLS